METTLYFYTRSFTTL